MRRPGPGVATLTGHQRTANAESDVADVALAASGDAHAFERLYRAHVPRIHSLVRRMLDDDLADEVTQDIFVRAWQKLKTFRGEAAFGTWLYRLGINVILARRATLGKHRARYVDSDNSLGHIPSREEAPDTAMDFEGALDRLPEGARQVFVLHDIEGYRHEEIAGMLGVAAGTSKSQLHRARMTLRGYLDR
jgi:RNA polymerase sigma-70 factor (ECF subfamily)